jgi:hypothetical protein
MAAISIAVCNVALAEVRASAITDIDDDSAEANACGIHYPDALQVLLESHEWGFARKRATLAALTNDRSGEWVYAYAAPSDMAIAGIVIYPQQTPLSGVYYPWPYDFPRPPFYMSDFVLDGTVIYSNLEGASFEYTTNDIDESKMPAMFKRALALELASRLATTLLNDRALKGDLIQQAEAAKRRAMAEDLNRYPRRDRPSVDDVAIVRS